MIIVTGAAGFIGSCLISKLNEEKYFDIVAVDDFKNENKNKNLAGKKVKSMIDRFDFFDWLDQNHRFVQFIYHIGARTDTTEFNVKIFNELNLNYSKQVWKSCVKYGIPLVYASSAATYGAGELGYDDDPASITELKPLNPYGISKNDFDKWAISNPKHPYFWTGLKFFNVYGPNEYHKNRMASVVFHAFNQIKEGNEIRLFRSHLPAYADGEQKRDFVYVKDVIQVLFFLLHNRKKENNGIYNLGTGKAETFNILAESIFNSVNKPLKISYIDIPVDIRDKYQYFTEAKMVRLRRIGYNEPFKTLAEGIDDYVTKYLAFGKYL